MAGGNVSPRQKMINMMYLVLTALLALNVSAEILNAFKLVRGSLEKTNEGIEVSIEETEGKMKGLGTNNPKNLYIPIFTKLSNDLKGEILMVESFIVDLDTKVSDASKGKDDDTESTDRLLAEGSEGDDLEAQLAALAQKIEGYSLQDELQAMNLAGEITDEVMEQFMLKYSGEKAEFDFEAAIQSALTYNLEITDQEAETSVWHEYNFRGVPAIGARTILTKLLSDLKTMKKSISDIALTGAKNSTTQKVVFKPVVATNGSFFNLGESFEAKVSVGSFDPSALKTNDSTKIPQFYQGTYTPEFEEAIRQRDSLVKKGIVIDEGEYSVPSFSGWPFVESEDELPKTSDGQGLYTESVEGNKIVQGAMLRDGIWYDWQESYKLELAGESGFSLTNMDVMFAGVSNPVKVTLAAGEITGLSCSWGRVKTIDLKAGKFEIIPNNISGSQEVKQFYIEGTNKGEKITREEGMQSVRVRDFPAPAARHMNLQVGDYEMSRGDACAFENGIATIVATPDENSLAALFKAKFVVTDWKVFVQKKGEARYEADWRGISGDCGKQSSVGTTVTIVDIKAKAPSGKIVDLAPITYTITK